MFARTTIILLAMLLAACGREETAAPATPEPPAAAADASAGAVDVYHGVSVEDPYRWLEDWDDARVKEWSAEQNAHAREVLAALPGREAVHARISEILKAGDMVSYSSVTAAAGRLLAIKRDPAFQQGMLVLLGNEADPAGERVVLDPNQLDPSGSTTIDWFEPSHDGTLVAVSQSSGGSESGDIHVYRIADGQQQDVVIERVNAGTAGGDLAWFADDSGFYYTRYPRKGERAADDELFYQQVWSHRLGTAASEDEYQIGRDFPRIAEIRLRLDAANNRLLVWVQDGDSGRFAMHLRQGDGSWAQFADFGDGVVEGAFGDDGMLYLVSLAGSPRGRILRLDPATPALANAVEVVPERAEALNHSFYYRAAPLFVVRDGRMFVIYQDGGPGKLLAFTTAGKELSAPPQLPVSALSGLCLSSDGRLLYANGSYVEATQWMGYDPGTGTGTRLAISSRSPVDYSDVEVRREFATSKDGTHVPVNILLPQGMAQDGSAGILVTGYGGYGVSLAPQLSSSRHILFEHGIAFAEANLRGGGEFGEDWHRGGNLLEKQNVFDDFAAVIRYLVEQGYAAADRVAIVGGSNGGLLMGATITQHPELATVVVSHVGVYDMLRSELDPNGHFNIPEYGTVADPDQFAALYAYSPYHHVRDGVRYPPILLPTGANDPRVNPMHSRKFAARLEAAQGGEGVVLLRTSSGTGHGLGTPLDEIIELLTDQYAFIFHHLGVAPASDPEG